MIIKQYKYYFYNTDENYTQIRFHQHFSRRFLKNDYEDISSCLQESTVIIFTIASCMSDFYIIGNCN